MIASPLGGLYEVASVAEHEGETEITIDVSLRWRVEAIKADYFVTPTVNFGWKIMKLALCHDL